MNGCISTHLEVVPTDTQELTEQAYYSVLRLHLRGQDENCSHVEERFRVSFAGVDSHVKFRWFNSNLFVKLM